MSRLALAAARYRRQRNTAWAEITQLRRELTRALATNHDLSATLRRMDATNAVLSAEAASRDMKPMGRFTSGDAA